MHFANALILVILSLVVLSQDAIAGRLKMLERENAAERKCTGGK